MIPTYDIVNAFLPAIEQAFEAEPDRFDLAMAYKYWEEEAAARTCNARLHMEWIPQIVEKIKDNLEFFLDGEFAEEETRAALEFIMEDIIVPEIAWLRRTEEALYNYKEIS